MNPPFICVEGVIGVGKTTLVKQLTRHFQTESLFEIVAENPYLEKFYDNMDAWSFQTEMFFLCNRIKQLEDAERLLNSGQAIISDYYLGKNLIFANRTLQPKKFDQYKRIYHILTEALPQPTAIIYLKGDLETIMTRIRSRNRSFERNIDPVYIEHLIADYEEAMEALRNEIPIYTIDASKHNFVADSGDVLAVANRISHLFDLSKEI